MGHSPAKAELMLAASHADIVGKLIKVTCEIPSAIARQCETAGDRDTRKLWSVAAVNLGAEFGQIEIGRREREHVIPGKCQTEGVNRGGSQQVGTAGRKGIGS